VYLEAATCLMQALSLAVSSRRSRQSAVKSFLAFCQLYQFDSLPAAPDTLVLYCTHMALVRGLSEPTIRNYLSAVRQDHLSAGYTLPTPSEYFPLAKAIRGAKRLLSRPVRQKLPISPSLIARLVAATDWGSPIRCLYLTLWLTFARLASVIPVARKTAFSPRYHLAWRHVSFSRQSVTIILNTTKTIQCQERQLTFNVRRHENASICLWTQLRHWKAATIRPLPDDPVFLRNHDSVEALKRWSADIELKSGLRLAGARADRYGWSSFRRGGATTFFLATGDSESMRIQGDWVSSAYRRYLAVPASARAHIAAKIQDLIG
jgi:hypothetical protein